MKKNLFEIYLTSEYIEKGEWLKLFLKISKINGRLKPWNLWVHIENNYIRYFVETKRMLPPAVAELGGFLFKKTDIKLKEKSIPKVPYILTKNYQNVLDIYDNSETKRIEKLRNVKITFYSYKHDNYLSTTTLYLKTDDDQIIKRRAFLNFNIAKFISIDFGIHTRFFYKKEEARYLETNKTLSILRSDKEKALLKADVFPYLQENLYLNHNDYDFARHSVVVGASGTGKSKLISSLIKNLSGDISKKLKYKIVVIDPHAAIEEDIGGMPDCNVVDFKTEEDSIDLFINGIDDILSATESIITIFKSLIADRYNSKLERVIRYSTHLLLAKGEFNLITLRKLLIEIEYRNKILQELEEEMPVNIIEFFRVDFNELKTKSYQEAIAPIIAFIDEMQLLPAFNSTCKMSNIKDELEKSFITVLSLDQMTLGLNITKTIAGFAMQSILGLVQAHTFDEHIILVIDEVSVIENPIIARFLSEARKYNLSLILAGQYFEQISSSLQKAIFANVVNYFVFRVSRSDARALENHIKMDVAVKNSHINRVKILTELEDRECIVRIGRSGRLYPAFKGKTMDFVSIPRKKSREKIKCQKPKEEKKNKSIFSIETRNTLKDIMKKQSTARKRVNLDN